MMYWGERMVNIATSDNLIDWTPELDANGNLKGVVYPREGHFDSALTECGPPALLTDKGILLLYNGQNRLGEGRDKRYPARTYSAGQILFDAQEPGKVIGRLDVPFFRPVDDFEKSGQYKDGTVFHRGAGLFQVPVVPLLRLCRLACRGRRLRSGCHDARGPRSRTSGVTFPAVLKKRTIRIFGSFFFSMHLFGTVGGGPW